MASELIRGFEAELNARADRRTPGTPAGAASRYGWDTNTIAAEMGVSTRTARRWRQFDAIPSHRWLAWRDRTRAAERRRIEARMSRRGLSGLAATGTYQVSRSRYRTTPGNAVRTMPGTRISAATMREVLEALEAGQRDQADAMLTDALTEAYGVGQQLDFEQVESVGYTIG